MEDFSSQTMKSRKAWSRVLQVLHENKFQCQLLCPAKTLLQVQGRSETFPRQGTTKEFHDIIANTTQYSTKYFREGPKRPEFNK